MSRVGSRTVASFAVLAALSTCNLLVDTKGLSDGKLAAGPDDGGGDGAGGDGGPSSGDATTGNDASPDKSPLRDVVLIAAGGKTTCAAVNNTVSCWGANQHGQVGDGSNATPRPQPTRVEKVPPGPVNAISTSDSATCGVFGDDVWCWGDNSKGQLGKSAPSSGSVYPARVPDLPAPALDVKLGRNFSCALLKNNRVYCWGENSAGQLADGATQAHAAASAVLVENGTFLEGVSQISSGDDHACALLASGAPYCWGHNDNDVMLSKSIPAGYAARATPIVGLPQGSPTTMISIGGWHTCAVVGGGVWCWGLGTSGELGNGLVSSAQPLQVGGMPAGSGATFVEANGGADEGDATCVIKSDKVWCWGKANDGRLGAGQTAQTNVPAAVDLPAVPIRVVGAHAHFCALLANGALYCWGRGNEGQIGDGGQQSRPSPVLVTPLR